MKYETADPQLFAKFEAKRQAMTDFLAAQSDVVFAYVYGSFANDEATERSDVDIGVFFDPELNIDYIKRPMELAVALDDILGSERIDCVALNAAPLGLCFNVVYEGELLVNKNDLILADFEIYTTSKYLDRKYYRDRYDQAIREDFLKRKTYDAKR